MQRKRIVRLVQLGITLLLVIEVLTGLSAKSRQVHLNNQEKREEVRLERDYNQAKVKAPQKSQVKANYKQAMKLSQKYLNAVNALHDQPTNSQVKKRLKKMPVKRAVKPLVPVKVKNWHSTVAYSGQDYQGHLMIAFQYFGPDNKLRQVTTCTYNAKTHYLEQFSTYRTALGRQDVKTVK